MQPGNQYLLSDPLLMYVLLFVLTLAALTLHTSCMGSFRRSRSGLPGARLTLQNPTASLQTPERLGRGSCPFQFDHKDTPLYRGGVVPRAVMAFGNPTKSRGMLHELQQDEVIFQLLFENNPLPMWVYDLETLRLLEVNVAAITQYGYSRDEFLRLRVADIDLDGDVFPFQGEVAREASAVKYSGPRRHRRKDGQIIDVQMNCGVMELEVSQVVLVVAEDITNRQRFEAQLRHTATHDPLTGLANRTLFIDHLARAIVRAKRYHDYSFAVLFLDLDDFKLVNDTLGHLAGDHLLVAVAQRLTECLRDGDLLARFGGDEFVLLLDHMVEQRDALRIAERIQEKLAVPVTLGDQEVPVGVSIGIAMSTPAYGQPDEMLRDADIALYYVKGRGKSNQVVFDESLHDEGMARLYFDEAEASSRAG